MSTATDSLNTYRAVFVTLLVFTALTVWVAFMDLGALNNVVALGIATVKATLVLLYFMHVRHSAALTKLAIASGVAFFFLLVAFTLADTVTRSLLGTVRPL
jgi:cytochrome c oxidase subunit 4